MQIWSALKATWSNLKTHTFLKTTFDMRVKFKTGFAEAVERLIPSKMQWIDSTIKRLHAWWSTKSLLATLLSSLIARTWVGLQTLWRFRLKDLSVDEMLGAWLLGCCQAHRDLLVGFLLFRYSVFCTVEALSLLYLLLYVLGDDAWIS